MSIKINEKILEKTVKAISNMPSIEHKRQKTPNKQELNKKFVMRLDRNGKPTIKEV